jgi:magnesium chelatase family protein
LHDAVAKACAIEGGKSWEGGLAEDFKAHFYAMIEESPTRLKTNILISIIFLVNGYACRRGPVARCAGDYQARLSGPLLDRIDLHIEVGAVTAADLILPPPAEGSREVAARVARARDTQSARYGALGLGVRTNAAANGTVLEAVAKPDSGGLALLRDAAEAMRLSARGYHRVLRVARTLADLDGEELVRRVHFAEALAYRALADEIRRAA